MDITQIPFNKFIRISQSTDQGSMLELGFDETMKNHIGTFHASAQFALAEACSGLALQNQFSDLAHSAVPVLRRSETKFKQPASSDLRAKASITEQAASKFKQQFGRKGRATIAVPVEITDKSGTVSMTGIYEWFVQKR